MLKRKSCTICKGKLDHIKTIKDVPVYMGVSDSSDNEYLFEDMIFTNCNTCGTLQLENLIDPEILYQKNHNIEIVGSLWNEHYDSFIKFITKHNQLDRVLEIGDPSGKIASRFDDYNSWTLVDQNPIDGVDANPKIFVINGWVDDVEIDGSYDNIIMSHMFEHLYDPITTIKKLKENNIVYGTNVFLSIPNFTHLYDKKDLPPAGLHFEHNIFLNVSIVRYIMKSLGFDFVSIQYYKKHSIFMKFKYTGQIVKSNLKKKLIQLSVSDIICKYEMLIEEINKKDGSGFIIYGAHFPAQFMFALGLDKEKFSYVMDASTSKQNKYLYGYGLKVIGPQEIKSWKNTPKILCQMGVYTEEIKKLLYEIREDIEFLC